jgi:ammonia channel protein AmtB
VIVTVASYISGWGFVKVAEAFMPVRASVAEEVEGLDLADHGVAAEVEPVIG